jgi:hypothetical protein
VRNSTDSDTACAAAGTTPMSTSALTIPQTVTPVISNARIIFGRPRMVASCRCPEFRLNVQPFHRFRFRDTNRCRGALIRSTLDRYNHNSNKTIFLISHRIANLGIQYK